MTARLRRAVPWVAGLCGLLGAAPSGAAAPAEASEGLSAYAIGMNLYLGPEYQGSDRYGLRPRPVWAMRWGRFRLSTSRGAALLGAGDPGDDASASADLAEVGRWRFSAGLRVEPGRSASDSVDLAGLPRIPATIRARLGATYEIGSRWAVGLSLRPDLLGKGGGVTGGVDVSYRRRLSPELELTGGTGFSLANAVHMRSYFGVDAEHVATSGYPAFQPAGGPRDAYLAAGLTWVVAPSWVSFAGVGVNRLLGDAALSPLTRRPTAATASVGLVYRCCR